VLGVHKGLSHFLDWQSRTFAVGPADRCAQLTNISFDVVLRDVLMPLWSGATLCLPPAELPSDRVLAWLGSEEITVVHAVPSLAQAWLAQAPAELSLPSLRWVFSAGEPLTDGLVLRWRRAASQGCGVVNLYGPTETTMAKCFYSVPEEVLPGVQPVGRSLPESQALVLTSTNRLCGVNELGEIVLRTPFRTRGYINAPEAQERQFLANPFGSDPGDVLYRTGDLGRYRPDGSLTVLARLDQQVKIRGVRIEPEEVSAVLSRHPALAACAVVARGDHGGEPTLVAYVVASKDQVGAAELRAFLAEHLPTALVPSTFVFLDHLPLTPNGKLDRRALPAPEEGVGAFEQPYLAPRTPIERLLAGMWAEVLGVPRVGVHDDFFGLGGHSLRATQIIARARAAFRIELPLRSLFETPTVAGLSLIVAQRLLDESRADG
jgi:acyl-coenzyme A synthetase/AMP-(fatty) acid ligase